MENKNENKESITNTISSNVKEDRCTSTAQLVNARVTGRPGMRGTNELTPNDTFEVLHLKRIPSPISMTPWNNITLVFTSSGTSSIKQHDMFAQLYKQIDPFCHFLGKVEAQPLSSDDEYDEVPIDLAVAELSIKEHQATQIRIRNIKIWVENSPHLSLQILEQREKNKDQQKIILSYRADGEDGDIIKYGCKLPEYFRHTNYYSIDHANEDSIILNYLTSSTSTVLVQFNAEWKTMSMSKSDFKDSIHKTRFEAELRRRLRLPKDSGLKRDTSIPDKKREAWGMKHLSSKVMRDWENDPIMKPRKEDKITVKKKSFEDSATISQPRKVNPTPVEIPPPPIESVMQENPLLARLKKINDAMAKNTTDTINDARKAIGIINVEVFSKKEEPCSHNPRQRTRAKDAIGKREEPIHRGVVEDKDKGG